ARDANYHESFEFSTGNPAAGREGTAGMVKNNPGADPKLHCSECRHFFITHEPAHPYGCRAMGFKSRELPCTVVLRSSDGPCLLHRPKGKPGNP
ncbi:MAG: hypothetical protein MUE76_03485, partial [Syntrophales bacterium]|nr:hypothetical protein [Syntrophales bacterium]